jgi:CheY-like chemotaxis protein
VGSKEWHPICLTNGVPEQDLDSRAYAEDALPRSAEEGPAAVVQGVAGAALIGSPEAQRCPPNGERQILLVEDEAFVRRVTAEVLESAGYRLLIAENAAEAMQICRRGVIPVHLLLTDVVLPGKNGRQLAQECRALYPVIRVLLMSGYAEQLALSQSAADGHEYLAKPFSTHTLLSKVREVLEGTSAGGRNANLTQQGGTRP